MTRKRIAIVAFIAVLIGIGWWCMSDGKSQLQRHVEAIGGRYRVIPTMLLAPSKYDVISFFVRRKMLMTKPDHVSLDFSNSSLDDEWIEAHSELLNDSRIRDICLSNTALTDRGFAKIAEIESVEFLDIRNTNVTDESIPFVNSLPQLSIIQTARTNITEVGLVKLLDKPSLNHVKFNASLLSDKVIDEFNARPKFVALSFDEINSTQLLLLKDLANVDALHLEGLTEAEVPALCQLTSLKYLTIKHSALSRESIELLKSKLENTEVFANHLDDIAPIE